jgi:hypothetical protein
MDVYHPIGPTDADPSLCAVLAIILFITVGILSNYLFLKLLFIVGSALKPLIFTFINWSRHSLSVVWNSNVLCALVLLVIAATLICSVTPRAISARTPSRRKLG